MGGYGFSTLKLQRSEARSPRRARAASPPRKKMSGGGLHLGDPRSCETNQKGPSLPPTLGAKTFRFWQFSDYNPQFSAPMINSLEWIGQKKPTLPPTNMAPGRVPGRSSSSWRDRVPFRCHVSGREGNPQDQPPPPSHFFRGSFQHIVSQKWIPPPTCLGASNMYHR